MSKRESAKTNKSTENTKQQTENCPTTQRKCVIEGKRFIVTRHFEGNKDLDAMVTEIAEHRANKEMGLC